MVNPAQRLQEWKRLLSGTDPSSALFNRVFAQASDFICLTNCEGHFLYLNWVLPGLTLETVLGTPVEQYLVPSSVPTARAAMARAIATRNVVSFESDAVGPGGSTSHYLTRLSPLEEDGEVVALVWVASDITSTKAAALAHKESEALLRLVLDVTRIGVWTWDVRADAVTWDARMHEILGTVRGSQATRATWEAALHPEDQARAREHVDRALGTGSYPDLEVRAVRPTGEVRHLLVRATTELGADGAVTRFVGGLLDVTDRVLLEEQLVHSQKLEGIGRLAGGIAHDFNNLLTVILGTLDLVSAGLPAAAASQADLQLGREAAERAATLCRQLLAFARKQPAAPKPTDLGPLLVSFERMVARLIGEDIEFVVASGPGLWPVRIDAAQLEQALVNLAVNARDAMPTGGTLRIETANVPHDHATASAHPGAVHGDCVRLTVRDTGSGMTNEVRAHAFEPFFTTKQVGVGTGLGLAQVHGIVLQNKGHIELESAVGKGTSISIFLPRCLDAVVTSPSPPPTEAPHGAGTLLLVEDEVLLRRLVARVLVAHGFTVLEAGSGPEALELSARHPGRIDLLLTDLVMPNMTGRELATRLEATRPQMRVLFVSGYAEDAVFARGLLSRGERFLAKPYLPLVLVEHIHAAMRDSRAPPSG